MEEEKPYLVTYSCSLRLSPDCRGEWQEWAATPFDGGNVSHVCCEDCLPIFRANLRAQLEKKRQLSAVGSVIASSTAKTGGGYGT